MIIFSQLVGTQTMRSCFEINAGTSIISLSLGASRTFSIRSVARGSRRSPLEVELAHGDILTMEGLFQTHWQHAVLRSSVPSGCRVNLTWRWVSSHVPQCPCALTPLVHCLPTQIPVKRKQDICSHATTCPRWDSGMTNHALSYHVETTCSPTLGDLWDEWLDDTSRAEPC